MKPIDKRVHEAARIIAAELRVLVEPAGYKRRKLGEAGSPSLADREYTLALFLAVLALGNEIEARPAPRASARV